MNDLVKKKPIARQSLQCKEKMEKGECLIDLGSEQ